MTGTEIQTDPFQYGNERIYTIDCDSHWAEPADLWTSRAPAKFRDRAPRVVRSDKGEDQWFVGDKFLSPFPSTVIDTEGNKFLDGNYIKNYDTAAPGAWDAKSRVAHMDTQGIWGQVVYPNVAGFTGRVLGAGEGPEFELFCVQAYNDGAAEMQEISGERIFPMAILPIKDMKAAEVEMRRAHEELHLRGFVIGDPLGVGLPDFTDDYWTPFWEYCNAHHLPVNFHLGASGINTKAGIWPTYVNPGQTNFSEWTGQYLAITSVISQPAMAAVVANFMYSELHDKYPNVNMVLVESGIGWIPYLLEALEYQLDETVPKGIRRGDLRPKEYFAKHWYSMFWFETYAPQYMLEEIGVHNVLAETDFPHPTCLYPNSREHLEKVLSGWDSYTRTRVLQDNAVELYKIPLPTE